MSEGLIDSISSSQEIASLRRGIKLKDEAYTNNVLLILTKQLDKGGEVVASCLIASGACSLIEQLFDTFQSSQSVCLHAFILLNMLTSRSMGVTVVGSSSILRKLLNQSETCSDLLTAIAAHLGDHAIVEQGIKIILYLSSHEILLKKLLIHENHYLKSLSNSPGERRTSRQSLTSSLSGLLINVMCIYSSDDSLMVEVCHIVYNLTYDDDEDATGRCKSYLVELGISELLVREILRLRNIPDKTEPKYDRDIDLSVIVPETTAEGITVLTSELTFDSDLENGNTMTTIIPFTADNINEKNFNDINVTLPEKRLNEVDIDMSSNQSENGNENEYREGDKVIEENKDKDKDKKKGELDLNIKVAVWGLKAIGSLCRHHSKNQQVFGSLGTCDLIMNLKDLFHNPGKKS